MRARFLSTSFLTTMLTLGTSSPTGPAWGETTIVPITEDTTLSRGLPDNNYGELLFPIGKFHAVRLGWAPKGDYYRVLMRTRLSTIPPGATILSGKLVLHMQGLRPAIPAALSLHHVSASWREGDGTGTNGEPLDGFVTWNSRRRRVADMQWETPGGDFEPEPFLTVRLPAKQDAIVRIELPAALVQRWLDRPSENHGFVIRLAPVSGEHIEQLEAEFFSSEFEGPAGNRPHLAVSYEGGDPDALRRRIDPAERVEEPGAVMTFPVSVPVSGPASLAIYDADGMRIVRSLWYGAERKAGEVEAQWDGTDEGGKPVPAGHYTWKVLQGGSVTGRYVATLGNGRQPWRPGDVGGYGVEATSDVAVDDDGYVYVCGLGHGRAIMKLSPDGKIVWSGPNTGIVEHPSAIALTDQHVYAANANEGWYRLSRKTGRVAPLANGNRMVQFESKPLPPGSNRWRWLKPFNDYPTRLIKDGLQETWDTRGLVVFEGRLYLPFYHHHQVRVYDAESGDELFRWPMVHPAGITLNREGQLLIATERRIVKYDPDGILQGDVVVDHLGFPQGLSVGPKGNIYVTDLSLPNTVKVFSPDGRLRGTFGSGESLQGTVKHEKLYMPFGIDVDRDGQVYLAEWLFERVRKLSPDLKKTLWSAQSFYAENCCADRQDPSLIYGLSGCSANGSPLFEYRLDYETGAWRNQRYWSLPKGHPGWHVAGYAVQGSAALELEGHRFYFITHDTVNIFRMDGDHLVHVARIGSRQKYTDRDGAFHEHLPDYGYGIWLDADGNGFATEDEINVAPKEMVERTGIGRGSHDSHIANDGTVYYSNAAFEMTGVKHGIPQYDFDHMRVVDPYLPGDRDQCEITGQAADAAGNTYFAVQGRTAVGSGGIRQHQQHISWCNLRKVDRDGDMLWSVGAKARTFKKPGTWYYNTSVDWADGFLFAADEAGPVDIYTDDGLYVSTVLLDNTRGHTPQSDVMSPTPGELWHVAAYRHTGNQNYYLLCQSHEGGGHIRAYEVVGLEQVKRGQGTLSIGAELAATFRKRSMNSKAVEEAGEKIGFVMSRRTDLPTNGDADKWPRHSPIHLKVEDTDIECEIRTFYDGEFYYVAAICRGDETPALNANAGNLEKAWSGDALEIYLSGDPEADPSRKAYTATDFQIILPVHGTAQDQKPVDIKQKRYVEGGKFGTRVHGDKRGWSVTARIPWSHLGAFRPVADDIITGGFKINLSDRTGEETVLSIFWSGSGRAWVNPSEWGKLKMKYIY